MFEVAGLLWNSDTLLADEAGGLWLQGSGEGVQGPMAGELLPAYPSRVVAWADWREAYPRGEVLSRETGSVRDYTADPYGTYADTQAVLFPLTAVDARLPVKEMVYGITVEGNAKAYPVRLFERQDVVDDVINNVTVRLQRDEETGAMEAFIREAGGVGEALPLTMSYWFFWFALHPSTGAYLP